MRIPKQVDVYSFGVILWELCTLQQPYNGMNPKQSSCWLDRLMRLPLNINFIQLFSRLSRMVLALQCLKTVLLPSPVLCKVGTYLDMYLFDWLNNYLIACWSTDPNKRPTLANIIKLLSQPPELILKMPNGTVANSIAPTQLPPIGISLQPTLLLS